MFLCTLSATQKLNQRRENTGLEEQTDESFAHVCFPLKKTKINRTTQKVPVCWHANWGQKQTQIAHVMPTGMHGGHFSRCHGFGGCGEDGSTTRISFTLDQRQNGGQTCWFDMLRAGQQEPSILSDQDQRDCVWLFIHSSVNSFIQ